MLYKQISLLLMLYLMKPVEMETGIRNKRVLFGLPGYRGDRDRYQSFRYYVFLAEGPLLDKVQDRDWLAYWLGLTAPLPSELVCGGVLLTPSIVQTACHCLSDYILADDSDNVSSAYPMNVWEDRIYSYFGSNIATEMWDMLRPKYYLVYSKCKKIEGEAFYGVFDYGLIISGDTVFDKNQNAKISYAPVYESEDILKFYYKAIQEEYMCLLIGHGPYQTNYDDNDDLVVSEEDSLEIRWGWRTIMNYLDCLSVAYSVEQRSEYTFNYTREATWVCGQSFSSRQSAYHVNTEGDSGGPMTCNDIYFSVFSMTTSLHAEDVISFSSPIVNTHFENSADYRDSLLQFIQHYNNDGRPINYPEDPDVSPTPPFNFPTSRAVLSTRPHKTMNLILPILCATVFSTL